MFWWLQFHFGHTRIFVQKRSRRSNRGETAFKTSMFSLDLTVSKQSNFVGTNETAAAGKRQDALDWNRLNESGKLF